MPEKYNSTADRARDIPGSEELSALVDGEISGDIDAVLENASSDGECRAAWHRYHLIRDVIQRDYCPVVCAKMAQNISQQISAEETFSTDVVSSNVVAIGERASRQGVGVSGDKTRRRSWLPVAGLGLAASVAAAGFMAWQVRGTVGDAGSSLDTASIETLKTGQSVDSPLNSQPIILANATVPSNNTATPGTRWLVSTAAPRDEQVEQRLNSLLLNHLEDSTMGRVQGMLTHSRVVAYDSVPVNDSF